MGNVHSRYEIVRRTQIASFRDKGIAQDDISAVIDVLAPEAIADYLGLEYVRLEEISSGNSEYRTAGLLDVNQRRIYVSNEFPSDQQRLTGMHEVVHWLLHRDILGGVLHRDRPINPRSHRRDYNSYEWEATHLACLALMPEKLVKTCVAKATGLPYGEPLYFDESVAFYLGVDIETLRSMTDVEKAFLFAKSPNLGRPMVPLCEVFKVSPTAMAIRLCELRLIAPNRWRGIPKLQVVR